MSYPSRPPVQPPSRSPRSGGRPRQIGQTLCIAAAIIVGLSWFRVLPVGAAWAAFLITSIAGNLLPYAAPPRVTRVSWIIYGVGLALVLAAYASGHVIIGLVGFALTVVGGIYYWFA